MGWNYSISQKICTRFLLCCALLWLYIDWISHIHQAYFTGTGAIVRLPQCQQSNPDEYFMWIHYERLHNHNKAKHNTTVCIFLGIYCTYRSQSSTVASSVALNVGPGPAWRTMLIALHKLYYNTQLNRLLTFIFSVHGSHESILSSLIKLLQYGKHMLHTHKYSYRNVHTTPDNVDTKVNIWRMALNS